MKNKKNDKLKFNTMIIIIVLLLILTIINVILLHNKKKKLNNDYTPQSHMYQKTIEAIDEDLIRPTFYGYVFLEYKGEYSQNDIIKAVNSLTTKVIPEFSNKLKGKNVNEINAYFMENKLIQNGKPTNILNTNIGVQNEKAFEKLVKNLENINIPTYNVNYGLSFDKKTIQATDNGIKTVLKIKYMTDSGELSLNVLIKNKDENGVMIEICE